MKLNMESTGLFTLLFLIGFLTTGSLSDALDNVVDVVTLPSCDMMVKGASRRRPVSPVPLRVPDLHATWLSQTCEYRAGPQFVTRSYTFNESGAFHLTLHYYHEGKCQMPSYSLNLEGHVAVERPSLLTPGGTEVDYNINRLTLVPHTREAIEYVTNKLSKGECRPDINKNLTVHQPAFLYNSSYETNEIDGPSHLDCVLISSWNELQLMRVEGARRSAGADPKGSCSRKELFLGDLHSDVSKQEEYRPTAYQTPLLNSNCIDGCNNCKQILKGSILEPPILNDEGYLNSPSLLEGSWVSLRCEVQRFGLFLTRYIAFSAYQPHWHLKQSYYFDPNCKNGTYTIQASGSYAKKGRSSLLVADEYDMTITEMKITPNSRSFASQLNNLPNEICGKNGKWYKGKSVDITKTSGCAPIGLKVPSEEPEILRLKEENNGAVYLFLGQTPTWPYKGKGRSPRPTSFAPPLQKCDPAHATSKTLEPRTGARVAAGSSICRSNLLSIVLLLLVIIFATH